MDDAKADWYVGHYSRELVSVGQCRHFRDESATSIPQHWGPTLRATSCTCQPEISQFIRARQTRLP
jgi:hypothetical protein